MNLCDTSTFAEVNHCDRALSPLNNVKAGTSVRIKELSAAPEMCQRLREIGFCEEQVIRPITTQENFICQVCNSRLAISSELARMILVEPVRRQAA